ncbi:MAG: hypothetical protein V7782_02565 [Psychromonas sp.]
MKQNLLKVINTLIVLWICKVFLSSLPYKFSLHPDTQYIFGKIGQWMQGVIGEPIGTWFMNYGSYAVGTVELFTSLLLISPLLFWLLKKSQVIKYSPNPNLILALGGLLSAGVMAGAVFFHLFTPLGIEVIHEGSSDGGSLFYAAFSILILGLFLFITNWLTFNRCVKKGGEVRC